MQMNELSAGPLLKSAWQKFKSNWLNLTGVLLLIVAIQTVLGLIAEISNEGFAFFMSIIIFAAGIIMGMGFLNITIKIGRGDDFEIADLFGTIVPFFKYLVGTLLYGLIFYIGLILLVIPGIIWGIKFCLTPYS